MNVAPWGREQADDLVAIADAALPAERLTADELVACCWDDPGVVLGAASGDGAVAACARDVGDAVVAHIKLLAVVPAAQRSSVGRTLLDEALTWARDHGASRVVLGASAPFYLWPGVDVAMTAMLVLAESMRFRAGPVALNMCGPTTYRAPTPDGVAVVRALDEAVVAGAAALCRQHWPHWEAELRRGVEHGTCFVALSGDLPVGFACHSVNRAAWFGPTGTHPEHRRRGIAAALLGEVCRDLATAGHADVEIAWVGPIGFYARTMGASVSRTFVAYARDL